MADTPTIPNALTEAEWAELRESGTFDRDKVTIPEWGDDEWTRFGWSTDAPGGLYVEDYWSMTSKVRSQSVHVKPSNRHALAALALYEQPFGFTAEDVALLRRLGRPAVSAEAAMQGAQSAADSQAVYLCGLRGDFDAQRIGPDDAAALRSLADRIAALLPPEGP